MDAILHSLRGQPPLRIARQDHLAYHFRPRARSNVVRKLTDLTAKAIHPAKLVWIDQQNKHAVAFLRIRHRLRAIPPGKRASENFDHQPKPKTLVRLRSAHRQNRARWVAI